jgi:uncharacterized ubiquitin-like protein YukD
MNSIKVRLFTMGGNECDIETPMDIKVKDFILEVVIALQLPLADADNSSISWRIDSKDLGRTLENNQTLEQNGVFNGHRLLLIRSTMAG